MTKLLWSVLLALPLLGCGGGGGSESQPSTSQPVLPIAETRIMNYGYYSVGPTQVAETKSHTNVIVELGYLGEPAAIAHLQAAQQPSIIGLQGYIWQAGLPFRLQPNAYANIIGYLDRLKYYGLMNNIIAFYPVDEPNITVGNPADIVTAVNIVRQAAANYVELAGVKVMTTYSQSTTPYPGISSFDWVGFDNYSMGAAILGAPYDTLKAQLNANQKIVLVPGGYQFQDPQPFIDKALADPKVVMIMPFIWYDNADPANGVHQGIRSNGMGPAYCKAGRLLTGQPGPC